MSETSKDDAKAVEKESATDTSPEQQGEQPQAGEKKVGPLVVLFRGAVSAVCQPVAPLLTPLIAFTGTRCASTSATAEWLVDNREGQADPIDCERLGQKAACWGQGRQAREGNEQRSHRRVPGDVSQQQRQPQQGSSEQQRSQQQQQQCTQQGLRVHPLRAAGGAREARKAAASSRQGAWQGQGARCWRGVKAGKQQRGTSRGAQLWAVAQLHCGQAGSATNLAGIRWLKACVPPLCVAGLQEGGSQEQGPTTASQACLEQGVPLVLHSQALPAWAILALPVLAHAALLHVCCCTGAPHLTTG